jgi:hypothetical protein
VEWGGTANGIVVLRAGVGETVTLNIPLGTQVALGTKGLWLWTVVSRWLLVGSADWGECGTR